MDAMVSSTLTTSKMLEDIANAARKYEVQITQDQ